MIRLHTLGAVRLWTDDGSDVQAVLTQPLQVSLLTYLVAARPRGFHRRDTLLGLFWPELDTAHARGALNQAIYRLRGSLGRRVVAARGREEVGVDERLLWTDVVAFEQAVADGSLHEALELYQGDLLAGFFLSTAPSWERWLERERARLRRTAATAAWSLADAAGASGRPEDAGHWGRRALALGPGDEASLRRLITLLDRIGDRAGAVRAYEEAAELFASEYETEPSPETKVLIESVRARARPRLLPDQEEASGSPAPDASRQPSPPDVTAEVSRSARKPRLVRWFSLAAGATAVVLVIGMAEVARWTESGATSAATPEASGAAPGLSEAEISAGAPARTRVPEAATEYSRGMYYLSQLSPEPARRARHHFQRALDLDPTFADAWSGLAAAFLNLCKMSLIPAAEGYPRARAAAEEALRLDPEHGEAHALLGWTLVSYYWDTQAAERHFATAVDLAPNSAKVHRLYAAHLRNIGRLDEALSEIRRSRELDPLFAFSHIEEGLIHYAARDYERAVEQYEVLLRIAPEHLHAHTFIALAETHRGRDDEALAALARADPRGTSPVATAVRGFIHARSGRPEEARRLLDMLNEWAGPQPVVEKQRAVIHIGLGEHDLALDALERGIEEPTQQMRLLRIDPFSDPLREDPRFRAILRRVGLAAPSVPPI